MGQAIFNPLWQRVLHLVSLIHYAVIYLLSSVEDRPGKANFPVPVFLCMIEGSFQSAEILILRRNLVFFS